MRSSLVAAALAASALLPAAAVASSSDMRDLFPLPRALPDTYTGQSGQSDDLPPPPDSAQIIGVPSNVSVAGTSKPATPMAIDRFDLFYGFFFNGPSFGSSWGTTYGAFQQDTWPMYIYHTLDMQYHFTRNDLVGIETSAHQDLFSGVTPSKWTATAPQEFYFNDPQLWYKRRGILNNPYFSTDLQFDFWPGITDYSMNQMQEYFSLAVDTTWNLKLRDPHWNAYLTTRVRPYVYSRLQPGDTYDREWLDLAAGYYVGYSLSNSWQVNVSGLIDRDCYADAEKVMNMGFFSDDTIQLELNYYLGRSARIGAFVQTVAVDPTLVNSIAGLDITLNVLTAK